MATNNEIGRLLSVITTLSPIKDFHQSAITVDRLRRALKAADRPASGRAVARLLRGRPGFANSHLSRMSRSLSLPADVRTTWLETGGTPHVIDALGSALGRGVPEGWIRGVLYEGQELGLLAREVVANLNRLTAPRSQVVDQPQHDEVRPHRDEAQP